MSARVPQRVTVVRRLAREPLGRRPTTLKVVVRRHRCTACGHVHRLRSVDGVRAVQPGDGSRTGRAAFHLPGGVFTSTPELGGNQGQKDRFPGGDRSLPRVGSVVLVRGVLCRVGVPGGSAHSGVMGPVCEPTWRVYYVPGEDDSVLIVAVAMEAGPHRRVRVLDEPVGVGGLGEASRSPVGDAVLGEAKLMMPEAAREAFTLAEVVVDVVRAPTCQQALDAVVGGGLGVVFMGMFAAVDLAVIAPMAKLVHDLVDSPATAAEAERIKAALEDVSKPELGLSDPEGLSWVEKQGRKLKEPEPPEPPEPPGLGGFGW